jgi:hypothetical protein
MDIGLFAPPFGAGFHAACAIGRGAPDEATGRIWPHLGAVLTRPHRGGAVSLPVDRVPVGLAQ